MRLVIALLCVAACGADRRPEPTDAGVCASTFGICHAEDDQACFIAWDAVTGGTVASGCAMSFAACEAQRATAMRDAGCDLGR